MSWKMTRSIQTVVQLVRLLSSEPYGLIKTVISEHYCTFIFVEKERALLCFFLGDRQTIIWSVIVSLIDNKHDKSGSYSSEGTNTVHPLLSWLLSVISTFSATLTAQRWRKIWNKAVIDCTTEHAKVTMNWYNLNFIEITKWKLF